ncbi:hypothetical protein A5730_09215 [Mycobacterium sp. ACS4054]|uniref:SPW repeat protein n=1 Tax=Mycobacterium sp. ACS4054 TaxID=1834119 RepID=UPI0007FFE502|nr:SPW repeat protein [Mycobacterium sp. ACS4054]OBF09113.1 hypothetical protein A5730_09215 [Mycobacterium sp. ACS4054]
MSTVHSSIDHHPDLLALRASYDRVAESMSAHVTFGLALLTGLYVAASPWLVGFGATGSLATSDLIVGIAAAFLAYGFATALDRAHGLTWTMPVLGLWVVVSLWILPGVALSAGMMWSNIVAGVLMTVLGLHATYFGRRTREAATRA